VDHIAALLLGIGNGGVYAAMALALVLTYRSSGVLNFATGAIALNAAYTYAGLRDGHLIVLIPGLPTSIDMGGPLGFWPAVMLTLLVQAVLGALIYLLVFRPLRAAPPLAQAVASLGVLIVIQELMAIRQGVAAVAVAPIFPVKRWEWGSLVVLSDRFYMALSVVGLTLMLWAFFRFTRFGLVTRATADSQTGAFVTGVSPSRVALFNWMISAVVAGLAGILIAPISPLTPVTYTLFVVPALAAALVGGFQNLLPTLLAGLGIGMLQSWALTQAANYSWLPNSGSAELVVLVVVIVTLLVTGKALPVRGGLVRHPLGKAPRPRSLLLPTLASSLIGVVALAVTEGTWRMAVISTMIFAVIGLSQVIITGYAGQVSVAQLTLAGTAAFMMSYFTTSHGVPFPIAPLLSALVAAVIGVVIGLPALRLRGLTLGIVTLAFAYTIEAMWFRNGEIVSASGGKVVQPSLFGIDLGIGSGKEFPRFNFGLLCLVTLVIVAYGVGRLRSSALGSAMLAVRANERSASGLGVNVVRVKIISFALASFVAGIGGSLLSYRQGVVTFESYTTLGNLAVLSTAYLAGVTSVYGGILAGVLAASGIVFVASERVVDLGQWFATISAVGLIITLITHPEGLASAGHALGARFPALRLRRKGETEPAAPPTLEPVARPADDAEPVLQVSEVSVRYGGVVAVDGVDLKVRPGSVVGLIGPNGAGKTSVIDAVTGFARCDGHVQLNGSSIRGLKPHARVSRGLARTFQAIELYDDLSVEENVTVSALATRPGERAHAVNRALDLLGISGLRDRPAGELSQGERQLVSIARACAAEPDVLLLDEPAAGLDSTESQWLGERIRAIADTGTAVLLVDHDVALVLHVCDDIYVLDFGRVIAHGDPAAVRSDEAVADAYLGTVSEDEAVS
jgi:sulfate-transporting ATPase